MTTEDVFQALYNGDMNVMKRADLCDWRATDPKWGTPTSRLRRRSQEIMLVMFTGFVVCSIFAKVRFPSKNVAWMYRGFWRHIAPSRHASLMVLIRS